LFSQSKERRKVEYARERCGERTRRMVCVVRTSWCVFKRHRIWLAMVD
jgi:hypothetical protein